MLIRSQNKEVLTNLDQTTSIIYEDFSNSIIAYGHTKSYVRLGNYTTKEKAMKVLDMIEEKYFDANCTYKVSNVVFHMPADTEVE